MNDLNIYKSYELESPFAEKITLSPPFKKKTKRNIKRSKNESLLINM